MSIRPIDLQTMFMRMNDLSKEQSIAQNAAATRQAAQDAQAAKLAKEMEEKVAGLEEVPEGPEKIHDDQERGRSGEESGERNSDADGAGQPAAQRTDAEVIKDPSLGSKIDISG